MKKLTDKEQIWLGAFYRHLHNYARREIRGTNMMGFVVLRTAKNHYCIRNLAKKDIIEVHPYYARHRGRNGKWIYSSPAKPENAFSYKNIVRIKWTPELKKFLKQAKIMHMLSEDVAK
jgi:hypothetical protein